MKFNELSCPHICVKWILRLSKSVSLLFWAPAAYQDSSICHGWPIKKIYIYRATPVSWTLKGNKKTVQVRGNVSFWGKFQWTFDEGNGNLVQISKDWKLSEFELSGFYCIIINYYYPIIGQSGWKVSVIRYVESVGSPDVCALADYTSQPWMMSALQASHKCAVEIFTIHSPKSGKTNPFTVKSH